ncbi:glycosyl hydrolase family 18 protein [Carboxydochorda subterranea]|uniref:Glycosyl hydrolase family 18 protein n=1 Tax=Carboxydichorda subterranea TaxID=3109565 RepID=A0ABZ1C083_9FIRM|nr:glycosyl hydrolase family 18 protein [Limnochorda sp. L945t]WRP18349.1 glycosyl hydrolase family 18 protein [Limnochorda sp. L945t]
MSQKAVAVVVALILYLLTMGSQSGSPPGQSTAPPGSTQQVEVPFPAVVRVDQAVLRAGPGTSYDRITVLHAGAVVTVTGRSGQWYRVETGSGIQGWIWEQLVERSTWPAADPAQSRASVVGRKVIGYYVQDPYHPSYDSLVRYTDRLTGVAPWAWQVDGSGQVLPASDAADLGRALRVAGIRGLSTFALVHNYQNGTFDSGSVHQLLSDPAARRRAVDNLVQWAQRYGVSGINLDFENVPARDRQALTAFVAELAARLHADGRQLTIAVPAKTADDPSNSFSGAFDYAALGRLVDGVWLMTYDEHYRTGPPGPVASIGWVEQVVRFAVARIPPAKVLLGLPAYGYEWSGSGAARALTYDQAMARLEQLGAALRWHPVHKVPYFTAGATEVWFENRYSLGYKLTLVSRYGLGGVAIWRLGQEDPGLWDVLHLAM